MCPKYALKWNQELTRPYLDSLGEEHFSWEIEILRNLFERNWEACIQITSIDSVQLIEMITGRSTLNLCVQVWDNCKWRELLINEQCSKSNGSSNHNVKIPNRVWSHDAVGWQWASTARWLRNFWNPTDLHINLFNIVQPSEVHL